MSSLKKAVTRITLDLSMPDVQKSITCTRGDRLRLLEIIVTNEGKPFQLPPKWSALLFGIKPDGTKLENGCVVEKGRIVYDFESEDQIATCVGRYAVTVWIHDEEGVPVAAPKIWVNVIESGAQQIAESIDQFNVLLQHSSSILALQEKDKQVDESISALQEKDAQVDKEISGLKEKDAQVDEEISGLKEKDAQVDEEIKTLSSRLGNVVSSKVITIDPSNWTDASPYEARINIDVPIRTEIRSTVLLIPKNEQTRDESQAIELAVKGIWTTDQANSISVVMTRQDTDPPTIPLSYLALVVYDEEASEDSTATVEFVGVVNLPDELMEREVKRALEALGVTEDLITTMGDVDAARRDVEQAKNDIDQAKNDIDQAKSDIEETISISITNIPPSRWRDSDPYETTLSMDSISPGEIILLIPADSKTKEAAAKARLTVTPEPGGEDNRYVYVARSEASAPPAVNLEFIVIRLKDESTTDLRVALIGVDSYGDIIPASIDLSRMDEGEIVETFAGGTTKTTTIEYDADGNPVKITDGDGNVTVLTW